MSTTNNEYKEEHKIPYTTLTHRIYWYPRNYTTKDGTVKSVLVRHKAPLNRRSARRGRPKKPTTLLSEYYLSLDNDRQKLLMDYANSLTQPVAVN